MERKSIWMVVALVGGYILCQALADIGATKLITVAGVVMPAGTFIFAVTFTLRDLVHKRLGKEWARAAIFCAGAFNIVQAFYLAGMARLPSPAYFGLGDAWAQIFAIVPAITLGSITAELVSELVDTEVYHWWRTRFSRLPQWTSVLVSNTLSLPLDSLIFGTLAFVLLPPVFGGEALSFGVAMSVAGGQIVWKALVTLVSMPGIYLVKDKPLFQTSRRSSVSTLTS
jgi:hypothetical protein